MLTAIGPALAGLQPVFILIDTVVAIKDTIEAIPGLIALDIQPFTNALARVSEGVAKMGAMAPQVAVPIAVSDFLSVALAMVRAVKTMVEDSAALSADADSIIAAAAASVPPNVKLQATGTCIQAQADKLLEHANASLGPVGGLMGAAQGLLDLIPGMPSLPAVSDLTGSSAEEAIAALDALIAALELVQIPGA
jgi:hypothetical protein